MDKETDFKAGSVAQTPMGVSKFSKPAGSNALFKGWQKMYMIGFMWPWANPLALFLRPSRARGYKTLFMLNSAENAEFVLLTKNKIPRVWTFILQSRAEQHFFRAIKYLNSNNCWHFNMYSEIPLLRSPKIKTFYLLKTLFWKFKRFFALFSTLSVPLIRDHLWDCPKVVFKTTFGQSQRWS